MKKINLLLLIILILFSFNLKMRAQEDTVIIEKSTESVKESDYEQKRKYKYLDNNFREEKNLIKVGILPIDYFSYLSNYERFWEKNNIILSFEKKLIPSLSIIMDNNFSWDSNASYPEYGYSLDLGVRYYYSVDRKIKESTGANNFHSNYFSIKLDELAKYGYDDDQMSYKPYLNFSWGLQRRLGKIGYVDASTYVKFKQEYLEFGLKLQLGLALGF
jgi:hypothetical protein